jgi:hypothetical protein
MTWYVVDACKDVLDVVMLWTYVKICVTYLVYTCKDVVGTCKDVHDMVCSGHM